MRNGAAVEWFAGSFPGAAVDETIDGVRIVRAGKQWTVHLHAFRHYRDSLSRRFDVVIDQINTIPFFTPIWAGIPHVMLIHQLAREVWWYESPFPLSLFGYLLEPLYLLVYRRSPVLALSDSTKRDLVAMGFSGPISVISGGIEHVDSVVGDKPSEPTFIYVGRLAPSKRVEHIICAVSRFRTSTGHGKLWVVGAGSDRYQKKLVALVARLGVGDAVVFWGRVTASEKWVLMSRAHAILMTSVREGWGLVVTEASACGTPAVVYDVPGLRDSVRNQETGLVVQPSPCHLAQGMLRITSDPRLYHRLQEEGRRWSRTFTYESGARIVLNALSQKPVRARI